MDRIAKLAGIEDNDDGDEFSASILREKNIERLIRHAFDKIGLEINYDNYALNYEDSTRLASVVLEENRFSLRLLNRLKETGLSNEFEIVLHNDGLGIEFTVLPELDAANIA